MAITSIEKAPIGVNDLERDLDGSNSSFVKKQSDGGFRTDSRINASHIPLTTTTTALSHANDSSTYAAAGDTDVDKALHQVITDVGNIGIPDASTVEEAAGVLQVKDLGITTGKIALDAIDGTLLADNAVDSEHYTDGSIDNEHLNSTGAAEAVNTNVIRDGAITKAKMADNAIDIDSLDMDGGGAAPVCYPVAFGKHSYGGGGTTSQETGVTGITSADTVIAILESATTTTSIEALPGTALIDFTYKVDPGAGTVVSYVVYRATSA